MFRSGEPVGDVTDISDLWEDDFVTFLLGCSFTAEEALIAAGLEPRHIKETGIVPMFQTTKPTKGAGKFTGPFVVSMRPYTPENAQRAAAVTENYPMAHGGPIQIGDPDALGIRDIHNPEYGEAGGIEMTTGPLGQGISTAVGMAIAERSMNARYGEDLVDHRTWVIVSDGDLMEGILSLIHI